MEGKKMSAQLRFYYKNKTNPDKMALWREKARKRTHDLRERRRSVGLRPQPKLSSEQKVKRQADIREKLEAKAGRLKPEICDICGKKGRICFDHDHLTGEFRGWLCIGCNVALGCVGDDTDVLERLITYLQSGGGIMHKPLLSTYSSDLLDLPYEDWMID